MDRMWSPWRSKYIASFKKPPKPGQNGESIFTVARKSRKDGENLIVYRSEHCFVIMNRYPYNSGHVMVVPNRQVKDLLDLTREELADIMVTVQRTIDAMTKVMNPQGFNFGANLGRVSGAGIDDHVHFHIVPRWNGDTNFMPVVADVKVISEDMKNTFKKLRNAFGKASKGTARRR